MRSAGEHRSGEHPPQPQRAVAGWEPPAVGGQPRGVPALRGGAGTREAAEDLLCRQRRRGGTAVGGAPAHRGSDGPLVRPYTVSGGRTRPAESGLDMISIVVATREQIDWGALEPEHAAILRLCDRPVSVAEVSAHLDLPMTVVKVLLGDLIANGDLLARAPMPASDPPHMNVLQAVLDGIRRL
ncbi:hypothetical protein GCM10027570_26720 [Streptomonospora sediminis]